MKNKIAQLLMLVVLTVGFSAFANAQTGSVQRVTVPFEFIIGEKAFPAGDYTVSFGISSMRNNFLLRSTDGKQKAIINQTVSKASDKNLKDGNFVFYVTDGHYHLAEINSARTSVEILSPYLKKVTKTKKYEIASAR